MAVEAWKQGAGAVTEWAAAGQVSSRTGGRKTPTGSLLGPPFLPCARRRDRARGRERTGGKRETRNEKRETRNEEEEEEEEEGEEEERKKKKMMMM